MSKNRRRSARHAEIEEQRADVEAPPTDAEPPRATGKSRRRSAQAAEPSEVSELSVEEPNPAGNGRRRPVRHAEFEDGAGEVDSWETEGNRRSADETPDPGRGRRRSAQPAALGEPAAFAGSAGEPAAFAGSAGEPAAFAGSAGEAAPGAQPGAGRGRRRSAQAGERNGEPASRREAPRQPAVGALSGQLPHGSEYRAGEISTEAGRYLRQAARDDAPARFGAPTGEVDDAARRVWEIAFGLVVRRRFESDSPLAEISRTVATAVHEHAAAALPMLDAEMLVRHALNEIVPVGDIDGGCLVAVHLLLFASIADELALGDEELDAIIADAEEKASALISA